MIRVYEQIFTEEDAVAAYDAVKSGILSSFGPSVKALEGELATWVGRSYSLTCSSGTAALSLALVGLGVRNSRVAVPACSFAATAFAALEQGNDLVFIDADHTWNLSMEHLDLECKAAAQADNPIRAVIAVHNYGNPYDYDTLRRLADKYSFYIIEDACEAMYTRYNDNLAGSLGDVSVFSFYGNKLIACGEGGMVLTDDESVLDKMRLYRGQGQDPNKRFWHLIPAFNFRMTNLQAAVALSQFRRRASTQRKKMGVYKCYEANIPSHVNLQPITSGGAHSWWMVSVLGPHVGYYREMSDKLSSYGIETRPVFPPLPDMPAFAECDLTNQATLGFPVAHRLYSMGITLPSGPATRHEDVEKICSLL